jgi:hypothetical protein
MSKREENNEQKPDKSIPVLLSPEILTRVDAIAQRVAIKELTVNKERLTKSVLRTSRMRITKFLELMCETLESRLEATEKRNEVNSLLKMLKSDHISAEEKQRIVSKLTGNDGTPVDMSEEFESSVPAEPANAA